MSTGSIDPREAMGKGPLEIVSDKLTGKVEGMSFHDLILKETNLSGDENHYKFHYIVRVGIMDDEYLLLNRTQYERRPSIDKSLNSRKALIDFISRNIISNKEAIESKEIFEPSKRIKKESKKVIFSEAGEKLNKYGESLYKFAVQFPKKFPSDHLFLELEFKHKNMIEVKNVKTTSLESGSLDVELLIEVKETRVPGIIKFIVMRSGMVKFYNGKDVFFPYFGKFYSEYEDNLLKLAKKRDLKAYETIDCLIDYNKMFDQKNLREVLPELMVPDPVDLKKATDAVSPFQDLYKEYLVKPFQVPTEVENVTLTISPRKEKLGYLSFSFMGLIFNKKYEIIDGKIINENQNFSNFADFFSFSLNQVVREVLKDNI